ncbi:hypothetical protein QBC37DRAFT_419778 [Rhypophila decipiens]|uniref:Uncharacterized protein n=1 Tax=Rhypophila decipiens TaxID=261697 RepID=A0AAN6YBX4_9PEZI|nr:hypothetical protein QBC37DRAFT_419778 [Rhypophila decipiens]
MDSDRRRGKPAPWKPGFFARLPITAILAIIVALGACFAMVFILYKIDKQPIDTWPGSISPNVMLAIATTVANPALHFAFSSAVDMAWWSRSLDDGRTMADLHYTWALAASLRQTLTHSLRHPYKIGVLAAILNALLAANAPVLQRAVTISTTSLTDTIPANLPAAQELPQGYSGRILGFNNLLSFTTAEFSAVSQQYFTNQPIRVDQTVATACSSATCRTTIQAAGYEFTCTNTTTPFPSPRSGHFDIFTSSITYDEFTLADNKTLVDQGGLTGDPLFTYRALYKTTTGCDGTLSVSTCTIRSALVEYPVIITSNGSLVLDPATTHRHDKTIKYTPPTMTKVSPGTSTHGGIALLLEGLFTASCGTMLRSARGWMLFPSGTLTYQLATTNSTGGDSFDCVETWQDPTEYVLSAAREIIFRASVAAVPQTQNQSQGQEQEQEQTASPAPAEVVRIRTISIYTVNYAFAIAAVAVTLLTSLSILPLFAGFWRLGRSVSLSPVEIARAFGFGPLTSAAPANADSDALLKEVGEMSIRYGEVTTSNTSSVQHQGGGHGYASRYGHRGSGSDNETTSRKLRFVGDGGDVKRPREGVDYE